MEENPYSAPVSRGLTDHALQGYDQLLASRSSRFFAFFIDFSVFYAFTLALIFSLIIHDSTNNSGDDAALASSLFLLYLAINTYLLLKRGQSLGKLILRIRIINPQTMTVPGFVDLILKRYVAFMAINFIPLANILVLINPFMIFRESRKCWHDDFANTIVVKA